MAIDSYDIVVPPDYGDHLCIPCARALMPEHPDWDDPEDGDGNMHPIFDLDEVPYLITCGVCQYISTYGSFGPEAVDHGIEILREHVHEGTSSDYADVYADRLSSCGLGDRWEAVRAQLILDRYKEITRV